MKKTFLNGVCALMLFCSLAGCAGPEKIAWQLGQGQSYSVKVKHNSNLMMMFPGADRKENELVLTCKVIEKTEENLTIEATIESVKAKMSTLGGISCLYDSQTGKTEIKPPKKVGDERGQKFVNLFSELVGKKYQVKIDLTNYKAELAQLDEEIRKSAYEMPGSDMFGEAQVRMLMAHSNLIEYVTGGLVGFSNPVGARADAGWSRKAELAAPEVPLKPVVKEYTVANVGTEKDENLVKITLAVREPDAQTEADTKKKTPSTRFVVKKIEGNGEMLFSLDKGYVTRLKERITVDIDRDDKSPARSNRQNKPRIAYVLDKNIEFDMK